MYALLVRCRLQNRHVVRVFAIGDGVSKDNIYPLNHRVDILKPILVITVVSLQITATLTFIAA